MLDRRVIGALGGESAGLVALWLRDRSVISGVRLRNFGVLLLVRLRLRSLTFGILVKKKNTPATNTSQFEPVHVCM